MRDFGRETRDCAGERCTLHSRHLCSALGVATTALGARTVAEGRPDGMRRVVGTSLTSAVALGLALAAALRLVAAPLMRLMMAGGASLGRNHHSR